MEYTKEWLAKALASNLREAATSTQVVSALCSLNCRPLRIRIGGFPACGKSTLSKELTDHLDRAVHVESESWIFTLAERKALGVSGAHPDSYDIARAVVDLGNLVNGREVYLPNYSHEFGRHDGGRRVQLTPGSHVVIDGTPFTIRDFDCLTDLCLFLIPVDFEGWLKHAIQRDVETRFFSRAEATRHNMRKARDMEFVRSNSPRALSLKCSLSEPEFHYEVAS